jgi:RNA polymerase sigma-70 factor (ECF subfamily)
MRKVRASAASVPAVLPASPHGRAPAADADDRELVAAARDGSREALEILFRRHWPRMHRLAYLVCHDAVAAEDIAQEAFLSAVRALDRFDRRRPFAPWITRIVVNRAIDWTRARTLRREDLDDAPVAVGEAAADVGDDVIAALRRLPADQRAVVVLRHLLGYTPGEIGRMLDLPTGTVNSRMRRGLNALEGELE